MGFNCPLAISDIFRRLYPGFSSLRVDLDNRIQRKECRSGFSYQKHYSYHGLLYDHHFRGCHAQSHTLLIRKQLACLKLLRLISLR